MVFSACLPLAICAALMAMPARCWVFAGVVAIAQWALGWSARSLNRNGLPAFVAGGVLLVLWTVSTMRLSLYLVGQAVLFGLLLAGVVMRSAHALFRKNRPTDSSSGTAFVSNGDS